MKVEIIRYQMAHAHMELLHMKQTTCVHDSHKNLYNRPMQLFGSFNIRINCSGSYWDDHVFNLLFWPRPGDDLLSKFLRLSYVPLWIQWHRTVIIVISVTIYPLDPGLNLNKDNNVQGEHVNHLTTKGDFIEEKAKQKINITHCSSAQFFVGKNKRTFHSYL